MNTLVELKTLFRQNRVPITEHGGWYFKTGKDSWGMVDGVFYKNNTVVNKTDINQYISINKFVRKKAIKITPNKEYEDAS